MITSIYLLTSADGRQVHVRSNISTFASIECHTLTKRIAKRFTTNGTKHIHMNWPTKSKLFCPEMIYYGNDVGFN